MKLIINADDFGITESCTKAIAQAFEQGLITDTTMVANCKAFDLAVAISEGKPLHDNIGVHFNLTDGVPLTEKIKKCPAFVKNGEFHGAINRLKPLTGFEKQAVYEELSAQIAKIETAGIVPTHADSHHHIHTGIFIAPVVVRVCREHGIGKIRLHRNFGAISSYKMFVKQKFNRWLKKQGFTVTDWFGSLEDEKGGCPDGTVEIMVHPDYDAQGILVDRVDMDGDYAIGENLTNLPPLTEEKRWNYHLL